MKIKKRFGLSNSTPNNLKEIEFKKDSILLKFQDDTKPISFSYPDLQIILNIQTHTHSGGIVIENLELKIYSDSNQSFSLNTISDIYRILKYTTKAKMFSYAIYGSEPDLRNKMKQNIDYYINTGKLNPKIFVDIIKILFLPILVLLIILLLACI